MEGQTNSGTGLLISLAFTPSLGARLTLNEDCSVPCSINGSVAKKADAESAGIWEEAGLSRFTFTSKDGKGWKTRYWIDMERGVIVRRTALLQRTPDQGFREYTRIESDDHKEIVPGIWLPMRVLYESVDVPKDGGPEVMSWRFEGGNADWVVNKKVPDSLFRLTFPDDVPVSDHRKPKPSADAK